jgi:hypothetical protein
VRGRVRHHPLGAGRRSGKQTDSSGGSARCKHHRRYEGRDDRGRHRRHIVHDLHDRTKAASHLHKGLSHRSEDKLLFILIYLKTYHLRAVMGELFNLSQPHQRLRDVTMASQCQALFSQWLRNVKLCFWFPSARSAKALPPAPRPIRNRRVTSQG